MIADIYELSPMQRAMLFHAAHAPHSTAYFNQFNCKISGQLKREVFRQAWEKLVARHDVLRTSVHWEGLDKPVQVVHDKAPLPWIYQDWRNLDAQSQTAQWQQHLRDDLEAGFALDQPPLMRCLLARVAGSEYLFNWSHHHILMDGWCLSLALEEFFKTYQALASLKTPDLLPVAAYRTYIEWLQRQDIDKARDYWVNYLKDFRAATGLPAIREKSSEKSAGKRGANEELECKLSEELSHSLRHMASQCRITPSILIQGAWALLLSRYSGARDVVFGVTVAGRPPDLPDAVNMLGLFINTIPVRVQVDETATLVDWLQNIQARQADRSRYEYAPLSDIQRWSEMPRGTPLFNSSVIFMNYPLNESLTRGIDGLVISDAQIYDEAEFPLQLQVTPGAQWTLAIAYDGEAFERDTIARLLEHVELLLSCFVHDPARPLRALDLVSPRERHQLLHDFNHTATPFDPARSFVHRFEHLVALAPDRRAVSCAGRHLSRRQLNRRANRLARLLLRLPPRPAHRRPRRPSPPALRTHDGGHARRLEVRRRLSARRAVDARGTPPCADRREPRQSRRHRHRNARRRVGRRSQRRRRGARQPRPLPSAVDGG